MLDSMSDHHFDQSYPHVQVLPYTQALSGLTIYNPDNPYN